MRFRNWSVEVVALVGLTACSSPTPDRADPPTTLPTTVATAPCSVGPALPADTTPAAGLVTVDADPTGAVLIWEPGPNDPTCRAERTSLGPDDATTLAADIRAADPTPDGEFSCPASDASGVTVWFAYDDRATEVVRISLTGCASVDAPGRRGRTLTDAVRDDLTACAPPAWRDRVGE